MKSSMPMVATWKRAAIELAKRLAYRSLSSPARSDVDCSQQMKSLMVSGTGDVIIDPIDNQVAAIGSGAMYAPILPWP